MDKTVNIVLIILSICCFAGCSKNDEPPRKESFKVQDINEEPIDLLTIPQDHYDNYVGKKVRIAGILTFPAKGGPIITDVNGFRWGIWGIKDFNLSEENDANKEVTLIGILGYTGEVSPYAQSRVGYFIQSIK